VSQTQFKTAEGAGFESPAGAWFKTAGGLSRGLKQKPGEGGKEGQSCHSCDHGL